MPRVSIIVPSYNYARYLEERIVSLLQQTYRDFELIILDDASTDHSLEVISKYTDDPRVRTRFYTENSGSAYRRWNDGAKLAQGEYLLFAGADDSCHPTMLERLVAKLGLRPSIGLAFCQSWLISATGKVYHATKQWSDRVCMERWSADYVDGGRNECSYLLLGNDAIPNASAVLVRRRAFDEAGGFDVSLPLTADYMLWVRILLHWDVAFIVEPLNYFRYHPDSVSVKAGTSRDDASDIEEFYQVLLYLARQLEVPREKLEAACAKMAHRWVSRIIDARANIPLWRNRRIYRLARQFDFRIKRRLLSLVGRRVLGLV